jgi:hypothetical protein
MTLEADAALHTRWPDLIPRIQSEFAPRAELDPCAHVALRLEDATVISVSVTLPDGRAAARNVTRYDDVIPTLQALLLVPERPPTAATAPSTKPPPPPPRLSRQLATTHRIDRDDLPPSAKGRELGIELSVITGARIGDGQFGAGAGVLSFLEVYGWLLGFEGRVDGYRPIQGGDPETALALAILAGRRIELGGVALDLTAGPAVAMNGVSMSQTEVVHTGPAPEMPPPIEPPPEASPGPVPRLLLGARVGFRSRSVLRTFVGLDGEVGPSQGTTHPDNPAGSLPRFAIGLALGATVGTP